MNWKRFQISPISSLHMCEQHIAQETIQFAALMQIKVNICCTYLTSKRWHESCQPFQSMICRRSNKVMNFISIALYRIHLSLMVGPWRRWCSVLRIKAHPYSQCKLLPRIFELPLCSVLTKKYDDAQRSGFLKKLIKTQIPIMLLVEELKSTIHIWESLLNFQINSSC